MQADLYFSFRSPYSYLGSWRYLELRRAYDLTLRFRPVYPAAIRFPGFFKQRNPLFGQHLIRDVARVAEMIGVPCQRPDPDPVQFSAPGEVAEEQPYIHQLTYLGLEAARSGCGLEWACEVGKVLWGDHVKDWHLGAHIADATARAGLDLAQMEAAIAGNEQALEAEIAAKQADEEAAGHWGTPCLVYDGEAFFGQDRIDMAVWWMKQKGMVRRE